MISSCATIEFEDNHACVSWRGQSFSLSEDFTSFLQTEVRSRLDDEEGTEDFRSHLRGLALMRNVARMCAELGITSVGERIETESDRRLLLEAGVKYAQGYFYGRPIIDEAFFARSTRALRSAA